MEEWQINHINSNLPSLIQNTRCTVSLMALLLKKELITDENIENMLELGKRAATKQLYDILKTKIDGYVGVMEALKTDRQTGAWKTLKTGEETRLTSSENLDNQIQQLSCLQIQISDRVLPLKDVFPEFKTENARNILQHVGVSDDIKNIIANDATALVLDAVLPEPHPLYINRCISNRLVLDPTIFRLDCKDVFVFKGVERMILLKLLDPHVIRSSTEQLSHITCKHIHLDDDEDWDDLVDIAPTQTPIHLVQKEGEEYVLMTSSKVSSTFFSSYVRNGERRRSAYISEDSFVEQLSTDSKGCLICDIPGMGKSWLMESIARKVRSFQQIGVAHVFFVQLPALSKRIEESKKVPDKVEAIKFILDYIFKSKLVSSILNERLETNKDIKGIFFLDGFDEVSDEMVQKTTSFLEDLNSTVNIRIVISSRQNMRSYLEKTFNVISYDILPFSKQEQISCVTRIWQRSFPNNDIDVLSDFADQCITSIRRIQKNDSREILGVPLRCYILAIINENRAKILSRKQRKKSIKISEESKITSICGLYDKFMEISMQKVATSEKRGIIWSLHTFRALEVLFPEIAKDYKDSMKLQNIHATRSELIQVGLLWLNRELHPEFLHRSFAEYFVGKFMAHFWLNMSSFESGFVEKTISYVVEKILQMSSDGMDLYLHTINRVRFGFNYMYHYPLKPGTMFHANPVMMFMNSINISGDEVTTGIRGLKQQLESKSGSKIQLQFMRNCIREYLFCCIVGCIDKRLMSVLVLVQELVKAFFEETEIPKLFIVSRDIHRKVVNKYPGITDQTYQTLMRDSVHTILYYAAYSGSPEVVRQLFNFFTDSESNYLIKFCKNYSLKYWSPLEIAITTNDIDMFLYLSTKMSLPKDRHIVRCLRVENLHCTTEACIDRRILVFQKVLELTSVPHKLIVDDFKAYLEGLCNQRENFQPTWTTILFRNNVSLRMFPLKVYLKSVYGQFRFSNFKQGLNDQELIEFLLVMFGKPRNLYERVKLSSSTLLHATIPQMQCFLTEKVLQLLDLRKARKKLKKYLGSFIEFQNIQNIETLRILQGIFPSFAVISDTNMAYLHLAVLRDNVNWVKYLIECGYDVNKRDNNKQTPLFYARGKRLVEITRLLVEKGAYVNAVNIDKQTIVHRVIKRKKLRKSREMIEWVNYMLDKTEHQLWNWKNKEGDSVLDVLTSWPGRNHATTEAVRVRINGQTNHS